MNIGPSNLPFACIYAQGVLTGFYGIYENVFASVGQLIIWEIENQTLLGIIIDRKLYFNYYVTFICKKSGKNYLC